MTPSVTGVPPELEELPQAVLETLQAACAGDWRRVELTGPLQWVIHNNPQPKRTQLPDVRPRRHKTAHTVRAAAPRVVGPESAQSHTPSFLPEGLDPMVAAKTYLAEFEDGIDPSVHIALAEYLNNAPASLVQIGLAACRYPTRVEIDPATVEKGQPRLRFHRGDVMTVIGFSSVTVPYAIAIKHLT